MIVGLSWQVQAACTFFDDFKDNSDGTVTDPRSGLIWKRCAEGFTWNGNTCQGSSNRIDWFTAMETAKKNRFLGKAGWRIPTKAEFQVVLGNRDDCKDNTEEMEQFAASKEIAHSVGKNGTPGFFWSSSPDAMSGNVWGWGVSNVAWRANFLQGGGDGSERGMLYDLRLVRDSQSSGGRAALEFNTEYAKLSEYYRKTKAIDAKEKREYAARHEQNRGDTPVLGRGGLRELIFLEATKSYAARCNNGSSDVFERTALGQYCGGSSADGFKCFSTPSLTAQHICK